MAGAAIYTPARPRRRGMGDRVFRQRGQDMARETALSRLTFLGTLAAVAVSRGTALAADPPIITRRVEKLYKVAGCRQPNDLQFVPDGLWILDQVDPNKAFKVRPEDGSIIQELQTESIHGSGI